jgi:hypothetical protein
MATFILTSDAIGAIQTANFQRIPVTREQGYGNGDLGLPIMSYFEFIAGAYTPAQGGEPVQYDGVKLTNVLVTITQTKNIVTTAINGRNGTVKEYVSDGDYVISLTGSVVSPDNIYPTAAVRALRELMSVPASLEFSCPFLEQFDITNVVVTDFDFSETAGTRNMQAFTISLLSDEIIELEDL